MRNLCKDCDKKSKCFFQTNNLVCKKLLEYIRKLEKNIIRAEGIIEWNGLQEMYKEDMQK